MTSVKRQWVQVPPEVCSFTFMAVFSSLLFQFFMLLKPSKTLCGPWALKPLQKGSPISCLKGIIGFNLHGLTRVPKGRFQQLLIKGEAAKKPLEARLKGPEESIKIGRPTT